MCGSCCVLCLQTFIYLTPDSAEWLRNGVVFRQVRLCVCCNEQLFVLRSVQNTAMHCVGKTAGFKVISLPFLQLPLRFKQLKGSNFSACARNCPHVYRKTCNGYQPSSCNANILVAPRGCVCLGQRAKLYWLNCGNQLLCDASKPECVCPTLSEYFLLIFLVSEDIGAAYNRVQDHGRFAFLKPEEWAET